MCKLRPWGEAGNAELRGCCPGEMTNTELADGLWGSEQPGHPVETCQGWRPAHRHPQPPPGLCLSWPTHAPSRGWDLSPLQALCHSVAVPKAPSRAAGLPTLLPLGSWSQRGRWQLRPSSQCWAGWAAPPRARQLWLQATQAALLQLRGHLPPLAWALAGLQARHQAQPSAAAGACFLLTPPCQGRAPKGGDTGTDMAVGAAEGDVRDHKP